MRRITRALGLAAALAASTHVLPARAADLGPSTASQPTQADAPGALARPAPGGPTVGGSEEIPTPARKGPSQPGYVINTAEGDTLLIGGYVHTDARAFVGYGSGADASQFLLRQVRPVLEGTVRDHFDYRLIPDFAGGKVVVQEAFVDVRFVPWLKLRVGKLKSPVGLERLQNSNAVVFAERAFPTSLAPNRDTGLQLFGDLGGVASYAVAILDGAADNGITESDQDGNKEVAGRILLTPFARSGPAALKGLGMGASGTWGAPSGTAASPQLPSFGSPGQSTIFTYASGSTSGTPDPAKTAVAAGDHVRWDLQGYYYRGPLGLQGEYIASRQRVKKGAAALYADNRAWEVTASLVLTGEDATFRMIVPGRPFDPLAGRWGAVELAGRYQSIRFDDALFANGVFADPKQQVRSANAWGAGVNWYLDRSFRLMLDYDRTRFFGGASSRGQEIARTPEQVLVGRAQLVF
ncbi:MAG TPA: porin [Anaeromyxobacteraceae bacterium]|jgi:phosphate-selective porin OprO/OprP|nr:porin [Anaeromyxobacteraceae bacterium]